MSALRDGVCVSLGGGFHHAFSDHGEGFCVINDIAIAIRCLSLRAAVIDLDVHQGDGTAAIFEADPTVFTLSIHGANNFPFRKQRSRLDIALPDGTGDEEYLARLREALPIAREFRPEVVFYQSGVDGLTQDRLGRLSLTHAGLEERDRCVFQWVEAVGVPIVVTLGGGYSDPIGLTVQAHAGTFRVASRVLDGRAQPKAGNPRL
jgi:acetoin utilization deacetylase AcuC-like enzyme